MSFSERRKADRQKMADAIEGDWISAPGFTCERLDPAPLSPRGIWLELSSPRGACVTIDFDGESPQPDVHVVSWHMATDSDARFSACFASSRNDYHKRKATDVAYGFVALRELMNRRISALQSGDAFEPQSQEVAVVT